MVRDLPSGESFSVAIEEYEGIDVERITSEEAFKAAVRTQTRWRENLDKGRGAEGSHNGGYRNTGEAASDITVEPKEPGALEYFIGGDVVQLAVAEIGRVPTPGSPPPFDAIADWAREKGLQPEGDQSFEDMVEAIRWSIADNGLEGFAPGRLAGEEIGPTFEENVIRRINEELGE